MNQQIADFISQQLGTNEYNFIVKIHNFLYDYVDLDNVEINDNIVIANKMKIPFYFVKVHDFYPIEEWSGEIKYKNKKVLLTFGIDWLGIRYCGDNGYYLMMKNIDNENIDNENIDNENIDNENIN